MCTERGKKNFVKTENVNIRMEGSGSHAEYTELS